MGGAEELFPYETAVDDGRRTSRGGDSLSDWRASQSPFSPQRQAYELATAHFASCKCNVPGRRNDYVHELAFTHSATDESQESLSALLKVRSPRNTRTFRHATQLSQN